jgi:chromosomal replication initiation ATPase DnaA
VAWELIVKAVEMVRGGRWEEFRDTYGDWGRDAALYLGRKRGRLKLQELARLSGGVGYTVVAQATRRVEKQIRRDKAWRRRMDKVAAQLLTMKIRPEV